MMFGSDPEVFVLNNDGEIIPPICVEILGLERISTLNIEDPDYHPVYYKSGEISIIGDGAAFEFTLPPSENPEILLDSYKKAKEILKGLLPEGLSLAAIPAASFNKSFLLQNFPIEGGRLDYACRFGCDRQYNAYRGSLPDREISAEEIKFRYAGGHLHVSPLEKVLAEPFVFLCDIFLVPLVLLNSPYPQAEVLRQEFYGKPGNYRPQQYAGNITGVEYRTLSVSWLEDDSLAMEVFNRVLSVARTLENLNFAKELFLTFKDRVVNAILSYDVPALREIEQEIAKYVY